MKEASCTFSVAEPKPEDDTNADHETDMRVLYEHETGAVFFDLTGYRQPHDGAREPTWEADIVLNLDMAERLHAFLGFVLSCR